MPLWPTRWLLGGLLAAITGGCALTQDPVREPAPARRQEVGSLYARPWAWTDDAGRRVTLSRWRGEVVVVTAVFTACQATCPRTIDRLRKVQARMEAAGQAARFVLVTLDPANDTPARLRQFKRERGLPPSWTFLVGGEAETRDLAALLGIHLMDLDDHLMHDGAIVVFDERGAPSRSYTGWGLEDEAKLL